jgi:hypothetical protein
VSISLCLHYEDFPYAPSPTSIYLPKLLNPRRQLHHQPTSTNHRSLLQPRLKTTRSYNNMDLRQYLIAPHERPQQQSARHDIPIPHHQNQRPTKTLDPRLAQRMTTTSAVPLRHEQSAFPATHSATESAYHDGRSQQSQQQPQQHFPDQIVTREQVITGLAAYPDILAAILRSGHIPTQPPNDTRESAQYIDTLPPVPHNNTIVASQQTNGRSVPIPPAAFPSSSTPATKPSLPTSTTPTLCFWHYHFGSCINDPTSPTNRPSSRPCLYLHSTEGMREIRVQQGKPQWHRQIGDCGLELCKFSSNYTGQEERELTLQQKKDYRKWKSEGKKRVDAAALAHEPVVKGLGGGGLEEEVEEQDVNTSSGSTISHQGQDRPETASTTHDPITPIIPTSPKAGRHAKGSRAPQPSVTSLLPTSSTLKRKSCVTSSQNTPTPVAKRPKTGPSASVSSLQTMVPGSVVPVLSKKASKRLKRQANKASERAHGKPQEKAAMDIQSNTAGSLTNARPLDIVSDIPSSTSTSHTTPPYTSLSHAKPSKSKPSQQTVFCGTTIPVPKRAKDAQIYTP